MVAPARLQLVLPCSYRASVQGRGYYSSPIKVAFPKLEPAQWARVRYNTRRLLGVIVLAFTVKTLPSTNTVGQFASKAGLAYVATRLINSRQREGIIPVSTKTVYKLSTHGVDGIEIVDHRSPTERALSRWKAATQEPY